MKKILFLVTLSLLVLAFVCGCSSVSQPQQGLVAFEPIETSSNEFKQLYQGDFQKWYDDNHKEAGLHAKTIDKSTYIIISAGEKPTGGYNIEEISLKGTQKEIEVQASLKQPAKGENVTYALTYPHVLIKIVKDPRELVLKGIDGNETPVNLKKDTGRYVGQIDNNSIEIKISGVPEKLAAKAFQLGDEIRDNFSAYQLKTDDEIGFTYVENENRPIIIEIHKLH